MCLCRWVCVCVCVCVCMCACVCVCVHVCVRNLSRPSVCHCRRSTQEVLQSDHRIWNIKQHLLEREQSVTGTSIVDFAFNTVTTVFYTQCVQIHSVSKNTLCLKTQCVKEHAVFKNTLCLKTQCVREHTVLKDSVLKSTVYSIHSVFNNKKRAQSGVFCRVFWSTTTPWNPTQKWWVNILLISILLYTIYGKCFSFGKQLTNLSSGRCFLIGHLTL